MLGSIAYSLTTQHHIYPHSMFKLFTKNKSGTLAPATHSKDRNFSAAARCT